MLELVGAVRDDCTLSTRCVLCSLFRCVAYNLCIGWLNIYQRGYLHCDISIRSVRAMYHREKREGRAYRRARASSNGEGAAQIPLANATENTTD